ncbi:CoA transferase [Pseudonocardia nantongensis]|uniref:CoA transferase n=1 Tax=Pseudonocardia nantongensis TaxID=1181885 RepID=UPI00397CE67F
MDPVDRKLGVDDLTERAEFSTPFLQARNGEAATALLAPAVAELTNLQALEAFETAGLACAPRLGLRTLLDEPRVDAGPLLVDVDVAGQPAAQMLGHPVHMSRSRAQTRRGIPALGQDTETVLAELGFTPGEIRALAGAGAIRPDADREIRAAANYV